MNKAKDKKTATNNQAFVAAASQAMKPGGSPALHDPRCRWHV